ncbi:hypothetical protein BJY04DRAFT_187281 [Aspergillus karnatakaensis]|uniref:putative GNAT family acetyltransferase n=1 Tax=Aspergillus karnatakaensis TaxID=1810916 RepID=UPI003CCCF518
MSQPPANTDRFQLRTITDTHFPALISTLWHSFENPYQGILRLFFPILDNDRATSLKNNTKAQLEEYHQQQPNVTWVTIVDTQNNDRIAAAAKWYFFDKDPFTAEEREGTHIHVADWYPEGVGREFASLAVGQFEAPRERMSVKGKGHAFLHIAFTHPEYRRLGLGRLFMDWGLRIADERGLESWLDATQSGRPLYELYGFRAVLDNIVKPVPERELSDTEKEEWKYYEETLLPIDITHMWRPPRGEFIVGKTVVPTMPVKE